MGGTGMLASALTGLPPSPPPESMNTQAEPLAYHGCMRNLVLNGAPVTWPHSVGIQGAVGASGCPAT